MQKKLLWLAVLIIIVGIAWNSRQQKAIEKRNSSVIPTIKQSKNTTFMKGLFVPYWGGPIIGNEKEYDSYYYFGVTPTVEGEIEKDAGYTSLSLLRSLPEKKKQLVLKMLDQKVNDLLLEDEKVQKNLVKNVQKIMTQNTFSGIVLDLEVPFTLQSQKKNQITHFVQQICTGIHTDYKTCSMLIYGDFSFRNRPYDLQKLTTVTDKILLMAYDFHKAGGEPGPNFPFDRHNTKGEDGYDFKQMVTNATSLAPKEKIEVVFGMYGYDWTLNEQGTPLKTAQARTVNEIQAMIAGDKSHTKYKIFNNAAQEKNIQYTDSEGLRHVIWYEDEESSQIKIKYLQEQGISQVSFWAQSYF